MAKDKRNRRNEQQQTRLSPETTPRNGKKRKKNSAAGIVVKALIALVAIAGLIFLIVLGKYLYELFAADTDTSPSFVQHETTAEAYKNKVAYYLVGLLGEETGEDTAGLMLVCHDKVAGSVNLMQLPRDTYLGDSDDFAVKYIGGVWANPKPLTWCETCRCRVYEPEIQEHTHSVCDTELTEKTGSSVENLIDVFNEQYSMPIDGYFLFPTKCLSELVDSVGGITVELEKSLKVEEVTYKSGVRTLDGAAAVQYMTGSAATVKEDIQRLLRQRRGMAALLQRLFDRDEAAVKETLGTLMNGKYPIRTDVSVEKMTELIRAWAKITPANMTVCVAPGETVKSGAKQYYSLHATELRTLLNERFNPQGEAIEETHLKVEELREPSEAGELYSETLANRLSEQEELVKKSDEE